MKHIVNDFKFRLPALNANVDVCVGAISSFVKTYNPSVEELGDIRISVTEAFANCVEHAYKDHPDKQNAFVYVSIRLYDNNVVSIEISDNGCGFKFETRRNECIGFTIMNEFMDSVIAKSKVGKGTTILMRKELRSHNIQ